MTKKPSLLGYALLAYFAFVVCLITLLPFRFHWSGTVEIFLKWEWLDVILNVILFFPLGFLFRLTQQKEAGQERIRVLIYGFLGSGFLEIVQIFEIDRFSSPWDIMANSLGAWLGALFFDKVKNRLNRHMVSRFALELPLMNLFYLLGPLLWINGLSTGKDTTHLYLAPFIGLFGACILASVWANTLKQGRVVSANLVAVVTGMWFLGSSLPGLIKNPIFIFSCGTGITLFVRVLVTVLRNFDEKERRFEFATLKWIWPIYLIYVFLLAFWPWIRPDLFWKVSVGFFVARHASGDEILRVVEYLLVFTLLGYMVAEARGRKKRPSVSQ